MAMVDMVGHSTRGAQLRQGPRLRAPVQLPNRCVQATAEASGSPSSHHFLHSGQLSVTGLPHIRAGLEHRWPRPQEEQGEATAGEGYRERPLQVGRAN